MAGSTARTRRGARRLLAPEVIQTSAMDCGPAALKCLLEGSGIPVSYGRLREACQTDLDGTSIDVIESVAGQLGLAAEQVMVPCEYLWLPQAQTLPAMVVVRCPDGFTHFVVVWRRLGPWLQVMDPASGRRWVHRGRFAHEVFQHRMPVDADDWAAWAVSEENLAVLHGRLHALGAARVRRAPSPGRTPRAGIGSPRWMPPRAWSTGWSSPGPSGPAAAAFG